MHDMDVIHVLNRGTGKIHAPLFTLTDWRATKSALLASRLSLCLEPSRTDPSSHRIKGHRDDCIPLTDTRSLEIAEQPALVQSRVLPKILPLLVPRMINLSVRFRREMARSIHICHAVGEWIGGSGRLDHVRHAAQENSVARSQVSATGSASIECASSEIDQSK